MPVQKPLLISLIATLAVTGCGNKADDKKVASQVAAKVNSGEISVHQVNYVLQRTPGVKSEQAQEAQRQVLESLIDQELAVQQAIDAKLDRKPNVLQSLEAAKRDVLARAYLEEQLAAKGKASPNEIKQYFAGHPELFSARKIYQLEELSFAGSPETMRALRELLARPRTMAEVGTFLKARGVETTRSMTLKPAEQIAMEVLPKLAQQKEDQPQLYENGGRAVIVNVLAAKPDPLSESQAAPVIEQFLTNQQRSGQARDLLKQLRDKARIEYVGDFAVSKPAQHTAAPENKPNGAPVATGAVSKGIALLK